MSGLLNLVFIWFRDNDNSFVIYCRRVLKLEDHGMGALILLLSKNRKNGRRSQMWQIYYFVTTKGFVCCI